MKIVRSLIMFVHKMFTDDGIFVHLQATVEMTVRLAYIICVDILARLRVRPHYMPTCT